MNITGSILAAVITIALSGLPAVFFPKKSIAGQRLSTLLLVIGSLTGLTGTALAFILPSPASFQHPWFIPWGQFSVLIDPLSAFFLLLIFIVPALGSIYGLGYWKQTENTDNGQRLGFFFGLLTASMAMVAISRDAVLFLISWEVMALSAYFAMTTEDHKPEVRTAGWIYLVATHVGTLVLIAMFLLWKHISGSFSLEAATSVPSGMAGIIFILSVIGFGLKAGIMPFHVWLPGAHSNAPSHVSAVLSGVMLKMGIYGIIRMTGLFPSNEAWWGTVLLVLGVFTGVAGIAFALGQQDIKRVLAYSSIENIGIVCIGLGLALMGRTLGKPEMVLLGFAGALFHVFNHGFFKSLLFFSAGAILHGTHTKDMERLGGLMKKMPQTGILFAVGAVAICALPPLNGFVSEWLIYLGLFKTLGLTSGTGVVLAGISAVALAMIGSLAVAAMVKLFSTVFLGTARSDATAKAHESSFTMRMPMLFAAVFCLTAGLFPLLLFPLLEKAVGSWSSVSASPLISLVPANWISVLALAILAMILLLAVVIRLRNRKTNPRSITWDCGYAAPGARMQYTGMSFVRTLVKLFNIFLWPKTRSVRIGSYFPEKSAYNMQVPDTLLDRIVLPFFRVMNRYLPVVKIFQQGQTQIYVLYVLAIVLILFIL